MDQITLNGLYYDQTSVTLNLGGIKIAEFLKDISFDDTVTPTQIRGGHPVKLGTGLGTYNANAVMTVQQEAWDSEIQPAIASKGNGALTVVQFPIVIMFKADGAARISQIDMVQCRIVGRKFGSKNGNEGLVREIPLDVREIIENGVRLVPQRL